MGKCKDVGYSQCEVGRWEFEKKSNMPSGFAVCCGKAVREQRGTWQDQLRGYCRRAGRR